MINGFLQFLFIVILLTIFVFCWFYGDNLPNVRQFASKRKAEGFEGCFRYNEKENRAYCTVKNSFDEITLKHFFETMMFRTPRDCTWCVRCLEERNFYYEIKDIGEHLVVYERGIKGGRMVHNEAVYDKITFKKII